MVASKMPPIPAPEGVHTAAPAKASAAAKAGRPGQALSGATGSRQAATPQAGGNAGSSSGDDSSDDSSGGEVSEEGSSSDDEDAAAPSSAAKAAAEQGAPGGRASGVDSVHSWVWHLQGLDAACLQLLIGCVWLVCHGINDSHVRNCLEYSSHFALSDGA